MVFCNLFVIVSVVSTLDMKTHLYLGKAASLFHIRFSSSLLSLSYVGQDSKLCQESPGSDSLARSFTLASLLCPSGDMEFPNVL